MTSKQALSEARKRWGKTAMVQDKGKPTVLDNGAVLSERYCVGRIQMGMFFAVEGDGVTWEAAFAKVDEIKRKDRERIEARRKELGLA